MFKKQKTTKVNESLRVYYFKNGAEQAIENVISVTEILRGPKKGRHIVIDDMGNEFEIPNRYISIKKIKRRAQNDDIGHEYQ